MSSATPLSYSMAGAVAATGLSRSHLERAIHAGHLKAKKSGMDADGNPAGVWVLPAAALQDYIDGLVDA